jgi:hypothetical protein
MSNTIATTKVQLRYPWMFGRVFDMTFFFVPIFFGIALFMLSHSPLAASSFFWAILASTAFGAGPFHQGPTWFAYFDKKNREHYLSNPKKRIIFFVAPFAIILLTILGARYAWTLTIGIWMLWSVQHLVQQNVGILLLYHNHGKGEAIVPRPLEVRTQHAAALSFGLLFFNRVVMNYEFPVFMNTLLGASLAYTLIVSAKYIMELRTQIKSGAYLNVPATGFWVMSMFSLWPLAFLGKSFDDGYLIPLTVHWFQYIGLNYILVKNKYSGTADQLGNLPLAKPFILFFAICLAFVAINFGLSYTERSQILVTDWERSIVLGLILGLGLVHYFLDAFLWRFREPYQRQAILPYLIAGRQT